MNSAATPGTPTVAARPPHPKTTPIVPARSVAGRTLMLLIAIMTFLSSVTLGGVVLVQKSAIAWSSDVSREVTIQIKPIAGEDMDANLRLAVSLANRGKKVALVDANDRLGGTCLLWGCIPTKALLFTAEIWDHLKHADTYGIEGVAQPKLNWKNVMARKDDVITRHTKGLDFLMKKNKITTFKGFGVLTGPAKDGIFTVDVKLKDGKSDTIKGR